MGHSVSGHLALDVADYDRQIRRLVPAYEPMQQVLLAALGAAFAGPGGPGRVLDLGGGTGATAAAVAERFPGAEVEIWDTDPQMLEVARRRCARFGARVRLVERSFAGPLTECDAVVACIALHHVKSLEMKGEIYRNIRAALRPGELFVNADTAVSSRAWAREWAMREWVEDMGAAGIGEADARGHMAQWAREDYYPPLSVEFGLLEKAGFAEPECFWREAAAVVFGGVSRVR